MSSTTPVNRRPKSSGGFLAGLGALASIWPSSTVASGYPHRGEIEALRSDGLRIGQDLRILIEREHARAQAKPD